MSIPNDNKDIIDKLKIITEENIKSLIEQEILYSDNKFHKNFIQNHSLEYLNNSINKPIPINLIYHSLYDQDNFCQLSNGKLNFQRHNFSIRNDYDIKYNKKFFDNNSVPKYFKKQIDKCVQSIFDNESIKDEIDDLDNYPKIFEFQYNYQHPIPNPVIFGPKLLENTDSYKIIFISPICLIVEQKGECAGFSGIDCFYSAIRNKFDMELNEDLTIKRTTINCYFGVNFTKSNWLQGKIKSNALSQAEEGFTNKYLPAITKELNLTIKKYSVNPKKIVIDSSNSFYLDDLIYNDTFTNDSDEEKEKDKEKDKEKNKEQKEINKIKTQEGTKGLLNLFLLVVIIIACFFFLKFFGKEWTIIILLGVILYNTFLIMNKLNSITKEKNF